MGLNWALLFEAYRYTTVATATLCYYMQPVFLTLAAAVLLGEKLSLKKILCVLVALGGMVLISGAPGGALPEAGELRGIALGLGAAILYACVILCNKKLRDIGAFDKTIVQLLAATAVMIPYCAHYGRAGCGGNVPAGIASSAFSCSACSTRALPTRYTLAA